MYIFWKKGYIIIQTHQKGGIKMSNSIKSRLRKRGITMNMVATASGTSTSTVSQILNDQLNDRIKSTADRLIGVVDKEIMDSLNPEAYS